MTTSWKSRAGRLCLVTLLALAVAHDALAQTVSQARARAITWLLFHQNPTGSWGDDPRGELLATATALRALRAAGLADPQLRRAEAWLASRSPSATDDLAQLLLALDGSDLAFDTSELVSALVLQQVVRGAGTVQDPSTEPPITLDNEYGWGAAGDHRTNLVDSALALRALKRSGAAIPNLSSAITQLRETQATSGGDSGGWPLARRTQWRQVFNWSGYSAAVASEVAATAEVIRAAKLLVPDNSALNTDINEAVAWLRTQRNADAGWGKGGVSTVPETAAVYLALREAGIAAADADLTAALTTYLLPRQIGSASNPDFGSWAGDAFATALTLEAVESSGLATDTDGDGIPNASDSDDDNDGIPDTSDAFPLDAAERADRDGDGLGDVADRDRDGDGVCDPGEGASSLGACTGSDSYPDDPNAHADRDGDGVADPYDADLDGDGVFNTADAFPFDPSESDDADRDGRGDTLDLDDDNDLLPDAVETGTGIYAYSLDTGSDSLDPDSDGDFEIDGDDGYVHDPCCAVVIPQDLDRKAEPSVAAHVGLRDFLIFRRAYGRSATDPLFHPDADFVPNGVIDGSDWSSFSNAFGASALP